MFKQWCWRSQLGLWLVNTAFTMAAQVKTAALYIILIRFGELMRSFDFCNMFIKMMNNNNKKKYITRSLE